MNKKIRPLLIIPFLTVVSLSSTNVLASDWQENRELARLLEHIDAAEEIVSKAEFHKDPKKRLEFDYQALRKYLSQLKLGIKTHLNKPLEPRTFESISNSFSTYERQDGK